MYRNSLWDLSPSVWRRNETPMEILHLGGVEGVLIPIVYFTLSIAAVKTMHDKTMASFFLTVFPLIIYRRE